MEHLFNPELVYGHDSLTHRQLWFSSTAHAICWVKIWPNGIITIALDLNLIFKKGLQATG